MLYPWESTRVGAFWALDYTWIVPGLSLVCPGSNYQERSISSGHTTVEIFRI